MLPTWSGYAATVTRPTSQDTARHALSLPETWEDHPWGDHVAKVGRRIFAFLGADTVGVKLPESAEYAQALGAASPMAYGLGRHGWVTVDLEHQSVDRALVREWIEESYRAIAPKRLVRVLDGPETGR